MLKVELQILHKGCWGSDIHLKFPKFKFSSIDCRWVKGRVAHLLQAEGNSEQYPKIITYLKKRKDVSCVETISKDNSTLHLRILTKESKKVKHFSNIFFKHNCFPVLPTIFRDKYEIWTLGTSVKNNITKIYELLKKNYKINIKYIKEENIKPKLTKKQQEVLNYAKYFGYFEWPRKKTATEIAKIVNIPKTVFLSHLRKAENKIINSRP